MRDMTRNLTLLLVLAGLAVFLGSIYLGSDGVRESGGLVGGAETVLSPEKDSTPLAEAVPSITRSEEVPESSPAEVLGETDERVEVAMDDAVFLQVILPQGALARGAQVWLLTDPEPAQRGRFWAGPGSADALMAKAGIELRTDSLGRVAIPDPEKRRVFVLTRLGRYWGRASFNRNAVMPLTMMLELDFDVRVCVLDSSGVPVEGLSVTLQRQPRRDRGVIATVRTQGEEGIAHFEHLQGLIQHDEDKTYSVTVRVIGREQPTVDVDLESYADEVLVLQLPPLCQVTVNALGVDGEPFLGSGTALLWCLPAGTSGTLPPGEPTSGSADSVRLSEGQAHFPLVEAGGELALMLARRGTIAPAWQRAPGPTGDGEVVEIEARFGFDNPVVRLRALDSRGQPITGASLHVELSGTAGNSRRGNECSPVTDLEGGFEIDLPKDLDSAHSPRITVSRRSRGDDKASGHLDLVSGLAPGLHDLGDIRLEVPAILAAGRVVDSIGQPVKGAQLIVQHRMDAASDWNHVPVAWKATAADGSFEVKSTREGGELRIAPIVRGHTALWTPFAAGSRNLLLVLVPGGVVAGSVLLDDDLRPERVLVTLRRQGGEGEYLSNTPTSVPPSGTGKFRFEGLGPGSYSLRVLEFGQVVHRADFDDLLERREVINLAEIDDIVVVADADASDPRLVGIELQRKSD